MRVKKIISAWSFVAAALIIVLSLSYIGISYFKPSYFYYLSKNYNYYNDATRVVFLGRYKNLDYAPVNCEVEESAVDAEIKKKLDSCAEFKNITCRDVVKDGDYTEIDYIVTQSDKIVYIRTDVIMQAGGEIPDRTFTEKLIGIKIGETTVFNYKTNDMGAEKEYTVEATVLSIKEWITCDLNEEFVKNHTKYDTVAAYRDSVRKALVDAAEKDAFYIDGYAVLRQIYDESDFFINSRELYEYVKPYYDYCLETEKAAEEKGMELGRYLVECLGFTEAAAAGFYNEYLVNLPKFELCSRPLIREIAKREKIAVGGGDLKEAAAAEGISEPELERDEALQEKLKENVLRAKVFSYLLKKAHPKY